VGVVLERRAGVGGAAGLVARLQDHGARARARKVGAGDQSIVSAADDDGVVSVGHSERSLRELCWGPNSSALASRARRPLQARERSQDGMSLNGESRWARTCPWSLRRGCGMSVSARSVEEEVESVPIILVPGFWLGAWAWDEVA